MKMNEANSDIVMYSPDHLLGYRIKVGCVWPKEKEAPCIGVAVAEAQETGGYRTWAKIPYKRLDASSGAPQVLLWQPLSDSFDVIDYIPYERACDPEKPSICTPYNWPIRAWRFECPKCQASCTTLYLHARKSGKWLCPKCSTSPTWTRSREERMIHNQLRDAKIRRTETVRLEAESIVRGLISEIKEGDSFGAN